MTPLLTRGLGGTLAALAGLGIAALSHAPYRLRSGEVAMIRLTWRARPERIETCRTPSQEELAALPAHMRQQVICDGYSARYRLRVAVDGVAAREEVVRGSGLRHDRPIYILRDLPVAPGRHRIEVRFERIDSVVVARNEAGDSAEGTDATPGIPGRVRREAEERERRRLDAVPPALVLRQDIELLPRRILVVSYDAERRELVLLPELPPR